MQCYAWGVMAFVTASQEALGIKLVSVAAWNILRGLSYVDGLCVLVFVLSLCAKAVG